MPVAPMLIELAVPVATIWKLQLSQTWKSPAAAANVMSALTAPDPQFSVRPYP